MLNFFRFSKSFNGILHCRQWTPTMLCNFTLRNILELLHYFSVHVFHRGMNPTPILFLKASLCVPNHQFTINQLTSLIWNYSPRFFSFSISQFFVFPVFLPHSKLLMYNFQKQGIFFCFSNWNVFVLFSITYRINRRIWIMLLFTFRQCPNFGANWFVLGISTISRMFHFNYSVNIV